MIETAMLAALILAAFGVLVYALTRDPAEDEEGQI